jgi:hypothetical protein
VLMLKRAPERTLDAEIELNELATMRSWAACLCVVSIPAELESGEAPIIQAVSKQLAQESGFPASTLISTSLTALAGPGTTGSSIKALVRNTPAQSETWAISVSVMHALYIS